VIRPEVVHLTGMKVFQVLLLLLMSLATSLVCLMMVILELEMIASTKLLKEVSWRQWLVQLSGIISMLLPTTKDLLKIEDFKVFI
jgi:hypothetical protein